MSDISITDNPDEWSQVRIVARSLVFNQIVQDSSGKTEVVIEDIRVVWFAKILQNWKSVLVVLDKDAFSTGILYEVTFDGDKDSFYVDRYERQGNVEVFV